MRDWVEHAIWWHVYPLGFVGADTTGADRTPVRRLDHLERWLDHVVDLGANGLALGPVFESSTHGYDTIDYFRVDPRLGDDADLDRLVEAAHARGIRVLLDGVFNHVGREFGPFRTAQDDLSSPDASLFRRDASGALATFEGHDALVALDHSTDAVADLVVSVMTHWLARGVDGWRLDAAYAVPPEFWASVLPRVREQFPDAYVLGEVLHGDYADFVTRSTVDSVTQYELWKATWSALESANFFELDWTLQRHTDLLATFVPYTFVGNHDVTRLASQISDARHRAHALVVLLTVGGTPSVYYGDERGLTGVKEDRAGGDDAVRPAYPATPADLDPAGQDTFALHQELVGLRRRHPWLHTATTRTLTLTNTVYAYESVGSVPDQRLVVLLNVSDDDATVDATASTVLAGTAHDADGGQGGRWSVPGHEWAVLS
ncbi:alpha-amylase family protein [Sanguibacter suaedae]|uniref:Alpha-amylase family protein n=1 Tax=Sanguibacter suaedae TaxID=2795737 RepID=A0A934MAE6_9MICO|nr:alpha-amylase family protein [Sanguibacter suaedae]MBI9115678.1 alpha-amylase family protein [Sanguibacter suaedae]